MLVAGKTHNIFLLTGISNINIVFIKKKNYVFVNRNIYGKFDSNILNYVKQKQTKNITQTYLLKN